MIQYIEKLFQETKTIILPGLGALTITNPDTKELMFMSFLKHDDGALAGFIEKEAGISNDEAKKMVSDDVNLIISDLESGKDVGFGNFGSFKKGDDGEIEFENLDSDNVVDHEEEQKLNTEKEAELAATKKAEEDANAKKLAEDQKATEMAAAKKAEEEHKAKKAAEKKKAEEIAAKKEETEKAAIAVALVAKKAEEEAAAKKKEAEVQKLAEEKKAEEEAAKKKETEKASIAEAAAKKATENDAKKKEEEAEKLSAKKKADEDSKKTVVLPPVVPTPKKEEKVDTKKVEPVSNQAPEEPKKTQRATVNQVIPDVAATASVSDNDGSEKNILQKEELAANQKKLDDLKSQKEEPKKKRKRGVGFFILIFLLLLIVGGGTFVALNYEKAKEYLPFLGEQTVASNDNDDDTTASQAEDNDEKDPNDIERTDEDESDESIQEEEDIPSEETVEQESAPVNDEANDLPFHIVAGVFSEATNAERLAEKIRGMGYPATSFQRGEQSVVSVQSYATAAEAQAAIPSVADAAPSGWVLEWR